MSKLRWLVTLIAALSLVAAGCGDDDDGGTAAGGGGGGDAKEGPTIKIGAQDFGESAILAQIYGQVLAANGYDVEYVSIGGFRDLLLDAFDSGDVNFSPEYAASMLEFINEQAGEATSDAEETVRILQGHLDDRDPKLVALEPAPAVDTNAFVITDETFKDTGYEKLSDLPADGGGLELGAPADCETNPFCIPGLKRVYDVDLSAGFVPLETNRVADALRSGDVQIGVLFSTSGLIADEGWILLEDDKQMLAADNVTPVLSQDLLDAYGSDLEDLVNRISQAISTDELTDLNKRFDIDKDDADAIASDWIETEDLVSG